MLFNFKKQKEEKNIQKEMATFLQQEKERRKQAEAFVKMMLEVIPYAMEEVWGLTEKQIVIGDTVLFKLDPMPTFFVMKNKFTNLDVMELRGQAFWQSVQEVMNFTKDLLEDIKMRESGRNQLIASMGELTKEMQESSIVNKRPFTALEPAFLKNN